MTTVQRGVRVTAAVAVATAVLAVRGGAARADTSPTSTLSQLTVIESGDRNYKSFHGAVWLEQDKATTNYRWGGTQCAGKDLSDSTVQLLFAALRSGDQVSLEYTLADVKGKQYRCVTAVTFSKR